MHLHLRSRSTWLKQGPFPPIRLCCPYHHQYYEPLRLLIRLPPGFRFTSLYQSLRRMWATDRMRPLLFHHLLSTMHCIANIPYSLHRRVLHGCFSGSSPLLLPSPCVTGSALSCSPHGANMSALQVSLYVTGCCFASLSLGDTTLRHSQSPGYIGCLLPRGLTLTRTGLSPASIR